VHSLPNGISQIQFIKWPPCKFYPVTVSTVSTEFRAGKFLRKSSATSKSVYGR